MIHTYTQEKKRVLSLARVVTQLAKRKRTRTTITQKGTKMRNKYSGGWAAYHPDGVHHRRKRVQDCREISPADILEVSLQRRQKFHVVLGFDV